MVNKPKKVILHCSATPDDYDHITVKQIRHWHMNDGFNDVGYHFVITRQGLTEIGRPPSVIGAHCYGENTNSLGVCLVGMTLFTEAQIKELFTLYNMIYETYGIGYREWYTHNEFSSKTCPNISPWILRGLLSRHHEIYFD